MASQTPLSVHEPDGRPGGIVLVPERFGVNDHIEDEAGHGLHCDRRDSLEAKSAEDAWARTLAWFNKHLT